MKKAIHTNTGDQVESCQKKVKSIVTTTMLHKVSKQHVRTFQIAVKPPASYNINNINKTHTTQTKKSSVHNAGKNINDNDIHAIANQLKQRLSKAVSKLATTASTTTSTTFASTSSSTNTSLDENDKGEQKSTCIRSGSPLTTATTITQPRLKNLTLLKQYLLFVAQESGTSVNIKSADNGGHQIEIGFSETQQKQKQLPSSDDRSDAARLGARLIESHVHGDQSEIMNLISTSIKNEPEEGKQEKFNLGEDRSSTTVQKKCIEIKPALPALIKKKEKESFSSSPLPKQEQEQQATPHWATRRSSLSDRRRRPGRPPASSSLKRWVEPSHRRRRSTRNVMSYTSIVKCICDTPDEEYGSMVQCDDCQRWLHLECLKMSEAVLGETFRCPLCFVALGKETNKLVSSMTWRFAARRQSEQLAAANSDDSETSDCEQEHSYHHHSTNSTSSIQNRRRRSRLQQQKCQQQEEQQQKQEQQEDSKEQEQRFELSIVAPERNIMEEDDDHHSEDSSSSGSSPSEASTPEQTFYPADPFDAMDTDFSNDNNYNDNQMILDPDSIEFFSRLVYLQSLDSMQKEIFAPNASDVFLCDDSDSSDPIVGNTLGHSRYPSSDTLPSSMCTQLLKEFSFDSGPFWKTMR